MRSAIPQDWRRRWRAMLERTRPIDTDLEREKLLTGLSMPSAPRILAFVNAHAMNCVVASGDFFEAIRAADVLVRDGAGMAALYRLLRQSPGLNLNGTDLIPSLLARFDGRRIALYGTREPYLGRAAAKIRQRLAPSSDLVTAHGFLPPAHYVALALEQCPDLIVLGMGMPRQEQVAVTLRAALGRPCLIVCGGAIIDFLGAKTTRAPRLLRRIGLEWLFRLMLEPRRLFSRYVIGNPLFLLRASHYARADRR